MSRFSFVIALALSFGAASWGATPLMRRRHHRLVRRPRPQLSPLPTTTTGRFARSSRISRVVNLPTTLPLPRSKGNFHLTHRFNENLADASFDEMLSNLFGMDQGATIQFEYRFGVMKHLQAIAARTNNGKTFQFSAKYDAFHESASTPIGLSGIVSIEGQRQLSARLHSCTGLGGLANAWKRGGVIRRTILGAQYVVRERHHPGHGLRRPRRAPADSTDRLRRWRSLATRRRVHGRGMRSTRSRSKSASARTCSRWRLRILPRRPSGRSPAVDSRTRCFSASTWPASSTEEITHETIVSHRHRAQPVRRRLQRRLVDPEHPSPSTNPIFTAALSPANEVPPVTNAESTVSGNATITLNTTRDSAGNVTSASATFAVTLGGFPAGSNITAAHIHEGASTCACPVVVNTTVASGQ